MIFKKIISFILVISTLVTLPTWVFANEEKDEFCIVSTTPHSGAYNVSPINLKVQVEFSRDVDASTLTSDNITVSGEALGCIVATDTDKASIYLERSAVALKETYTVTFKEGVKSLEIRPNKST